MRILHQKRLHKLSLVALLMSIAGNLLAMEQNVDSITPAHMEELNAQRIAANPEMKKNIEIYNSMLENSWTIISKDQNQKLTQICEERRIPAQTCQLEILKVKSGFITYMNINMPLPTVAKMSKCIPMATDKALCDNLVKEFNQDFEILNQGYGEYGKALKAKNSATKTVK